MHPAHYPGRAPIDAYGNGGFRFAEMSHRGSMLFLPSGIYAWTPGDPDALVISDFEQVIRDAGEIEILLIGMGPDMKLIGKELRENLRGYELKPDPMSTGAAVRTFNVLLAEDRAVAAALIAVD